jgi:hypothetical protein
MNHKSALRTQFSKRNKRQVTTDHQVTTSGITDHTSQIVCNYWLEGVATDDW